MQTVDFEKIAEIVEPLTDDTIAEWGIMTPQHMIEHICGSWMISNGRFKVACKYEGKALEKRRNFLFSDKPFAKSIANPAQGDGLQKLRKASLAEAKEALVTEINRFYDHFDQNPDIEHTHPAFGSLDKAGWMRFQHKHMYHHLRQFGLI